METRELGKSGISLGVIGVGCWAMGGAFWGPADDQASVQAIQRSLDLGANFVDTAPFYGIGRSEEVVGRAIKGRREQVILATKFGLTWNEKGNLSGHDSSRKRILQEIDDSLRRLDVDCIDLYQAHWPDENTSIEEIITTMVELQQQGKIRAIGVSNYSVEQMKESMKYCQLDSIQPPYNMFQRDIEQEILPFCRENNIGVVSYGPMYQGLLTGKFFLTDQRPSDPLRSQHHELQGEKFDINRDTILKLKEIADARGKPLPQLAINWVLAQPGITVAICGARNSQQAEQNIAAAEWSLDKRELDKIEEILAERTQRLSALE
ncbi:MAG: aldo/keto reductase [Armatimonadetes bacterium]|nr:aldo/keto reductase [Armatimonadota bacterium]NIM23317.1 aldo/keto reductase [Armatimonadota bacterium]NIM67181.1 aldo/keto reductase [Armatimonadota bacterium]NIM75708.1 aldo/keto reductase [Armatimonadota bacterium]NIN05369.1 aldo/keto reductase [Armatimonadota bacterium]